MASKKSMPLESASSSSGGEEETSGEEEISAGEEEEVKKTGGRKPPTARKMEKKIHKPQAFPAPKPPTAKSQKDDSETESESESESDPESERVKPVPIPNVKPISSKPVDSRPVAGKRVAEFDADRKESKRAKESVTDVVDKSSEDVKKQLFQRLWSEDDEVAVLEGLIRAKKGVDVVKDMESFHEFIGKDLHIGVSLSQLKDKVHRLKKKFENNRKGKMGEEKTFNKLHDQKIFELSKKIWGSEVVGRALGDSAVKSIGKVKSKEKLKAGDNGSSLKVDVKNMRGLKLDFDSSSGMEEYVMKMGVEMLEGTNKVEMEEKLRQLLVEELKLFLKKNELVRECTKKVLAAYDAKIDEDQ